MKRLKILIGFQLKADPNDEENLKQEIHQYLQDLIDSDELEYEVVDEDEEDDDYV